MKHHDSSHSSIQIISTLGKWWVYRSLLEPQTSIGILGYIGPSCYPAILNSPMVSSVIEHSQLENPKRKPCMINWRATCMIWTGNSVETILPTSSYYFYVNFPSKPFPQPICLKPMQHLSWAGLAPTLVTRDFARDLMFWSVHAHLWDRKTSPNSATDCPRDAPHRYCFTKVQQSKSMTWKKWGQIFPKQTTQLKISEGNFWWLFGLFAQSPRVHSEPKIVAPPTSPGCSREYPWAHWSLGSHGFCMFAKKNLSEVISN